MDVEKQIFFRQIGAKVAYYRTLRGLTQEQLAKRSNLSLSVLGRIERGTYNKNVSVSTLLDIAHGLRIDMAMLVMFNDMEKKIWWERDLDSDDGGREPPE